MEEMSMLEIVARDNEWLQSHFEKVQKEHPNKFVAVSRGQVIAAGDAAEDVIKKAEKKGIDSATTLIEFIPEKGLILIL